jgi:hypothetical protein
MDFSVVTRDAIRTKAQREYKRGFELRDCPLPEASEAAQTWREEWRRLNAEQCAQEVV